MTQEERKFSHEMLPELFTNIHKIDFNSALQSKYVVTAAKGDVAEIFYIGNGEWRFIIDNYPHQRKFYQTNLPMESVYRFIDEMNRIGIPLDYKDNNNRFNDPKLHALLTMNGHF